MVRTSFCFDDDKELVQLARGYEQDGARISWRDVAHRMRHTRHNANALHQRLKSLMRTHGSRLAQFPRNYYTPVQRPRGRPSAVMRQLRELAGQPMTVYKHQQHSTVPPSASPRRTPVVVSVHTLPSQSPTVTQNLVSTSAPLSLGGLFSLRPTSTSDIHSSDTVGATCVPQSTAPSTPPLSATGVAALPSPPRPSELSNPNQAVQSVVQAAPSWIPPLSPTSAEHVVAAIFDDVPRQMILGYEGDSIHKNVGEVMPSGVTMLLAELGNIDGQDVFLDIGSGLGNIVAQVVLATDVYRVMGIEAREEVQRAGIDAINRSSYAWAFRERAPFISKDVSDIRLATNSPFAEATVVYWNNVLFEPRVVEHVKNELCTMANIRYLLSCVNFCPRHRPLCLSGFCASLDLMKVVGVPCSWKAKPQSVYIYKSKQNE